MLCQLAGERGGAPAGARRPQDKNLASDGVRVRAVSAGVGGAGSAAAARVRAGYPEARSCRAGALVRVLVRDQEAWPVGEGHDLWDGRAEGRSGGPRALGSRWSAQVCAERMGSLHLTKVWPM